MSDTDAIGAPRSVRAHGALDGFSRAQSGTYTHVPPDLERGLDIARIAACFMVVLVHVSGIIFAKFDNSYWWASNIYDSLARSCVPIFIMIAGTIFLPASDSFASFIAKRAVRVLPPLLFWSLFYMCWEIYRSKVDYGSARQWIEAICDRPVKYHLWFLYALITIYLSVPIIRVIFKRSNGYLNLLFLIVWFTVMAWATIGVAYGLTSPGNQVNETAYVDGYDHTSFIGLSGYLLLGAVLVEAGLHNRKLCSFVLAPAIFICCSAVIMYQTYYYSIQIGRPQELWYGFLSPFVIIASTAAFVILISLGGRVPDRFCKKIRTISSLSFGVYLVHIFLLDILHVIVGWSPTLAPAWWSIPVTAIVTYFLASIIIATVRQASLFRYVT